jgi:hypothetical protein
MFGMAGVEPAAILEWTIPGIFSNANDIMNIQAIISGIAHLL